MGYSKKEKFPQFETSRRDIKMRQAKIFFINPVAVKHCVEMLTRVLWLHREHQDDHLTLLIKLHWLQFNWNGNRQKWSMLMLMTLLALLPTHLLINWELQVRLSYAIIDQVELIIYLLISASVETRWWRGGRCILSAGKHPLRWAERSYSPHNFLWEARGAAKTEKMLNMQRIHDCHATTGWLSSSRELQLHLWCLRSVGKPI